MRKINKIPTFNRDNEAVGFVRFDQSHLALFQLHSAYVKRFVQLQRGIRVPVVPGDN